MFHRPKTAPSFEGANPANDKPAEAAAPAVAQKAAPQPQPVQYAEKESKPMNQQTPNSENAENNQTEANARSVDIPSSNPFQRPAAGQSPVINRMPGYGAAAPSYPTYGSAAQTSAAPSGRRLVIGEGITMSGEIESCDTLVVEGTVEAALKGASVLEISESGMFYGTVEINEATIAGKFEGDLTVNGRLTIKSSGSVTGAISYKELAVEAGAVIDGKINPAGGAKGANSEKKSPKGKQVAQQAADDLPILQRAAG